MNDIIQLERRIARGIKHENFCWKLASWLFAIWFCTWISTFIITGTKYFVQGNLFMDIISYELMFSIDVCLAAVVLRCLTWLDERKLKRLKEI